MPFITLGLNHKTAPIDIREKFCLTETQQELLLSELKSDPSILGAFVLSTCNRFELYLHTLNNIFHLKSVIKLIEQIKKLNNLEVHLTNFYVLKEEASVKHLLEVISGLDSLVIGEKQILGQVKASIKKSQDKGMLSKQFNLLSNIAIRTGKKVQHETNISHGGSSVSWAAIAMAEKVLGNLKEKSMLTIGAGKMGDMAVEQIASKGFKNLYLMNRTKTNADAVVEKYGGISASFGDIKEILTKVDICICCADAPHYIIEKDIIQKVMQLRNHTPLLLLDISMPRNIDPIVKFVEHVTLYGIDDLKAVVEENLKKRFNAVDQVEKIVSVKLSEFYNKLNKLQDADPEELSEHLKIS